MNPVPIGDALFTKTQQRVLGLLYGNPERSFYANEIVRWAGMGRGGVRRELDRLVLAGLLVTMRVGNQLRFQANVGSPVFHELRSLVVKTFGMADVLKEALRPCAADIRFAFVYGSVASATEQPGSDIDLMVVGVAAFEVIVGAVYPCQQALGREINPSLFSPEEFARKMNDRNSFIAQVLEKPKLMILGTEDDIRKLGENPSA
ncbi:MAG: transcriptional regulator [Gammaproteobacteria bacterium HGW-Gammaproteobacteria-1]|nr:MAG: transcriptional regulator [Gammaproteobacteria bacterium HGW-Gammaproteobacteria-1]